MRHPAAPTVSTVLATLLLIIIIYIALFYPKRHHEGNPAPRMESFEIHFEDVGEPTKTNYDTISDSEEITSILATERHETITYSDTIEVDVEVDLGPGTVEVIPVEPIPESRSSLRTSRVTYRMPSAQILKDWDDPLFEIEVSSCYISCEITTIQPAKRYGSKEPACLVVLQVTFHPALSHRFKNARLSCSFKPTKSSKGKKEDIPVVAFHAPRTAYGGYSKAESHWTYGLSAPLQAPGGYFSITPTAEKSHDRIVDHYMRIEGSARGTPKSKCIWTMAENEDSKAGLPLDFQVAVILHASKPFELQVDIESEIAKWWKSKAVKGTAVDPRVIDPTVPKGKQYSVGEDLEELKLASWFSGAVDNAVMSWNSAIPRP